MNGETTREYAARVAQANRSELVVIIYELFLHALDDAKESLKAGKEEKGCEYIKRAQGFLQELMDSLDHSYEISGRLLRLYRYVNMQLILSVIRKELVQEEAVREVMTKLKAAFEEVAKQDTSEPLMENTQQVYAGLTYGKGSLNEVLMSGDEYNRGYRV